MNTLKYVTSLSLIILFALTALSLAQDSSKIVILSEETGFLIDANEKKEYGIIPKIGDEFICAFFYMGEDDKYYCNVRINSENSFKDTILTYPYNSVLSIAARIQYKESMKKGITDFNMNDVELKFVDGMSAENLLDPSSAKIEEITEKESPSRIIPLAQTNTDYSQFVTKELKLGLGIGMIYQNYNFQDLSQIFYLIAKNVVKQPDYVSESDFISNSFPLFCFSSMFIIENTYLGEFEYALGSTSSGSSSLDYHSFSLSFSYLFSLYKNLSPYLSIGYSRFKFTAQQNYGMESKEERKLESILLEGAGKGVKLSIGVIYELTDFTSLNLFGSYRFISPIEVNNQYQSTLNYDMSFDMKGYEIGLKLLFRK